MGSRGAFLWRRWLFYFEDYIGCLVAERGASSATVSAYRGDLQKYCLFLETKRDVHEASLVQREDVAAFVADLSNREFAPSTIERRLSVAKGYHRFLVREGFAEADPTQTIPLPRKPHTLPDVLSVAQVSELLDGLPSSNPVEMRNACLLEVLYGCGLRVSELVGLDMDRVYFEEGYLRVLERAPKSASFLSPEWLWKRMREYLEEARPELAGAVHHPVPAVFLNARGSRLTRQSASHYRESGHGHRGREPASSYASAIRLPPICQRRCRLASHSGNAGAFRYLHHANLYAHSGCPIEGRVLCCSPAGLALPAYGSTQPVRRHSAAHPQARYCPPAVLVTHGKESNE